MTGSPSLQADEPSSASGRTSPSEPEGGPRLSPRIATFLMFVVHGVTFGTWVASIPGVKSSLDASGSVFGLALMTAWVGALLAQQITGQLLVRISSRRVLTVAAMGFPLLVVLPLIAPTIPFLAASLFAFGCFNAAMDLSMNVHGVALEDKGGRSIMSGLHAGWSLGAVIGSVGVALALSLGLEPIAEAALVGVLLFLLVLAVSGSLGTGSVRTEGAGGLQLPSRAVLPLAGLILLISLVMGGLTEWGGVYLDLGVGAEGTLVALAYAAFSLGLFGGRIVGDRVKDRVGSIKLMQWGMYLAAASIAVFLLVGNPWVALAGMLVAGIGVANTVPQIFGAAGRIPPGGPSLSAVYMTASLVFIVSPGLIGAGSDLVGIGVVFWLFAVVALVVALVVPRVRVAETNPRFRTSV